MSIIYGNAIGASGGVIGQTVEIICDDGTELMGVVTEKEELLDAKPSDVRVGKKVVSDSGIIEGTNTITYRTTQGCQMIKPGDSYSIPLSEYNKYDFNKLQCIIFSKNTNLSNSFVAEKIVVEYGVYQVGSSEQISTVTKNSDTKSIDLNLINDTNETKYIRFFTYKDEEE